MFPAFWREIPGASPHLERPELLGALDTWLDGDSPPFALVAGPPGSGKTSLLARWARAVAARGATEILFLPIDRRFGTAQERDALRHLFGMLPEAAQSYHRGAYTLDRLRYSVRCEIAWKRPPGERARLVLLDGFDQAEGWSTANAARVLAAAGERVRVLVSVSAPDAPEGAEIIAASCARLGWDPAAKATILVPALPREASHRAESAPESIDEHLRHLRARLAGHDSAAAELALRALTLLAAALCPLSLADLGVILGEPTSALLAALDATWAITGALLDRDDAHRGYRFRHEALRRGWQSADEAGVAAAEQRLVAAGLGALTALEEGRIAAADLAPYLVDHLGAHLTRVGASWREHMRLVGPAWRTARGARPDGVTGFIADVRRANDRVEAALLAPDVEPEPEAMRAAPAARIAALLRCALVEGAMLSLAIASFPDAPRTGPHREPRLDERVTTGMDIYRAEALVRLAGLLDPKPRGQVLELSCTLLARGPDLLANFGLLVELATGLPGARGEEIALAAIAAYRRPNTPHVSIGPALLRLATLLPPSEGIALVAEAVRHVSAVNASPRDLGLLADAAEGAPEVLVLELFRKSSLQEDPFRLSLLCRIAHRLPKKLQSSVVTSAASFYLDYLDELEPTEWPEHVVTDIGALAPILPERLARALLPRLIARLTRMPDELDLFAAHELTRLGKHLDGAERAQVRGEVVTRLARLTLPLRVRLATRCPAQLCALLGPEAAVEMLQGADEDRDLVLALSLLAPSLSPELRARVVTRVVALHCTLGDLVYTLWAVLECAPYMTLDEATSVFWQAHRSELGVPLKNMLLGYGWSPPAVGSLIHRLGGEAAVLAAAREIIDTATWLP